jgi:HEAT repeat protein
MIACDETVDDGLRSSAAEQLPELNPRAAAEAFRFIVSDPSMDDGLRANAGEQLARLNPPATV